MSLEYWISGLAESSILLRGWNVAKRISEYYKIIGLLNIRARGVQYSVKGLRGSLTEYWNIAISGICQNIEYLNQNSKNHPAEF